MIQSGQKKGDLELTRSPWPLCTLGARSESSKEEELSEDFGGLMARLHKLK